MQLNQDKNNEKLKRTVNMMRKPLYLIGLVIIIFGSGILIALGYGAVMIVRDPESLPLIQMILSALEITEPLIRGHVGEYDFAIEAAKPLRIILFSFFALIILGMGVKIISTLVTVGGNIMQLSIKDIDES